MVLGKNTFVRVQILWKYKIGNENIEIVVFQLWLRNVGF